MTDIEFDSGFDISDYLATVRRRRWPTMLLGVAIFATAAAVALFWPPTYRSSATILIEESDVPNDLVRSTVSTFADERLRIIQQRVMTTQNLLGIIDKFNLYEEARRTQPVGVIVNHMRSNIDLELVSADSSDARSGRSGKTTIAFNLSFDGSSPQMVQQVANELVTLYLSENQRTREEQAAGTAGFLTAESQRQAEQVQKLEAQLAQFKAEHAGSLPEEFEINTQLLDRTEGQLLEVVRQTQALRERQAFLESQLSSTDPYDTRDSGGSSVSSSGAQLRKLQAEYAEKSAKFGAQHPDVLSLRRQIQAMGNVDDGDLDRDTLKSQLRLLESDLAAAKERYGPEHPEVKRLTRSVESTKKLVSTAASGASKPASSYPGNPVYVQLQAQLSSVNAELDAIKSQTEALQKRAQGLEQRVFKSPEVERNYVALKRDYDSAVAKYEDLRAKESEAELAKTLESERMGERLSLIEPPALPTEPTKPNRPMILALGFVVAVVGSLGSSIALEMLGGRVYGGRQLASVAGYTPLAVVPFIETRRDRQRKRTYLLVAVIAAMVFAAAAALYLHNKVAPLDVLWAVLLNRLGI
jgi:uncharacterized protein involved in exopolysaccharide biosynthesis